jgi:hypothetical protein
MQITINEVERQILAEVLDAEMRELRSQNYHAESHEAKEMLKQREAIIRRLLAELGEELDVEEAP